MIIENRENTYYGQEYKSGILRLFPAFSQLVGGGNSDSRDRMKKILHKAIQNELTERQRTCIMKYYYQEMKIKDIAAELGLNNSTISRHISSGTRKLRKIAQYYS